MGFSLDESSSADHGKIPLIELPVGEAASDLIGVSSSLVNALRTSGFLLVQSPSLSYDLQQSALKTARNVLIGDFSEQKSPKAAGGVIDHPTDPKVYMMIESPADISDKCGGEDSMAASRLLEYWSALETVKRQILRCIAIGLELDAEYFVTMHSKNQSVLRLLHYYQTEREAGEGFRIRCKAHSDYGSITLLLTDGVPGLEALINDKWIPVPHVRGALVVNIGSLLQDWTKGQLLATLHRVVSVGEVVEPRTSLAFFADPDPDVSIALKETALSSSDLTVAEYIQWRSGGEGPQRSGVSFSKDEEERAQKTHVE
jgi:hypothetical protein